MLTLPRMPIESTAVGVPTPSSATLCGLPDPLSVTTSDAVRAPNPVGVKVTLIVQLAEALTVVPQVVVRAKSPALVPVIRIEEIVSAPVPLLVSVTTFNGLVVPTT